MLRKVLETLRRRSVANNTTLSRSFRRGWPQGIRLLHARSPPFSGTPSTAPPVLVPQQKLANAHHFLIGTLERSFGFHDVHCPPYPDVTRWGEHPIEK
jgi:hypothetical protein